MSEFAPPHEPGDASVAGAEALTPAAIETVLADFRSWLERAVASASQEQPGSAGENSSLLTSPSVAPLDLHTLLGQFVALRHEVNLQTKASRAQQEQSAGALASLERTLEALEEARTAPPTDESVRLLLKTLVELHDNLALARREVQRTQEEFEPLLEQLAGHEPEGSSPEEGDTSSELTSSRPRQSWWTRWFGVRRGEATSLRRKAQAREARRQEAREAAERLRRFVTSLITGYTMSLHRVERALHQHDLEAIATVGLPFDPETMEVLEVVYQAGRKSTEVIEEVRRGYVWRGQVFRFAQVRVARSPSS